MQLKFKYVNKIRDFDTDLKFFMFDVSWQDEFHHDKVFSYFRNINVLYLVTVSVFYLLSHWPAEMFNNYFKIMTASCFKNEGCVYTGSWTKHYRILLCLMLSWDWQRKLVLFITFFTVSDDYLMIIIFNHWQWAFISSFLPNPFFVICTFKFCYNQNLFSLLCKSVNLHSLKGMALIIYQQDLQNYSNLFTTPVIQYKHLCIDCWL